MKHIHVVAGLIYSPDQQEILIARRPDHLHQGGLWEFPGGKVDRGESAGDALRRELFEELGIQVTRAEPFHQLSHEYIDKAVFLDFWIVHTFTGEPRGVEGQQIAWVGLADIHKFPFPAANRAVVELLSVKTGSDLD